MIPLLPFYPCNASCHCEAKTSSSRTINENTRGEKQSKTKLKTNAEKERNRRTKFHSKEVGFGRFFNQNWPNSKPILLKIKVGWIKEFVFFLIEADFEGNLPIDGWLQQKTGLAWRREAAAEREIRRGERKMAVGVWRRSATAIQRKLR